MEVAPVAEKAEAVKKRMDSYQHYWTPLKNCQVTAKCTRRTGSFSESVPEKVMSEVPFTVEQMRRLACRFTPVAPRPEGPRNDEATIDRMTNSLFNRLSKKVRKLAGKGLYAL